MNCKHIRCKSYTFSMCPSFHCNHTVLFTFNCCSVQWNKCNTVLQWFTVTSILLHCKVYSNYLYTFSTCPSFHCNSTVYICSAVAHLVQYHVSVSNTPKMVHNFIVQLFYIVTLGQSHVSVSSTPKIIENFIVVRGTVHKDSFFCRLFHENCQSKV